MESGELRVESEEKSRNSQLSTLRSPLFGPDWWADDAFVVGYGLDYNQCYRGLPYIGTLRPHAYQGG